MTIKHLIHHQPILCIPFYTEEIDKILIKCNFYHLDKYKNFKHKPIMSNEILHIIGAGLAGSEAAWQAAQLGVSVVIHEMRPVKNTAAHKTDHCAELVCSNSFRSDDAQNNAVGLLHEEMRRLNSLIMREGDLAAVPAGGALAVDRNIFSENVTNALINHPLITFDRSEVSGIPPQDWKHVIIATGPLTSEPLSEAIKTLTGEDSLAFFDALAPIVHTESINMDVAWYQSRYDKTGSHGTGKDYINCPMTKDQYEAFIHELVHAEYGEFKDWEKDTPYFEGCMPVEVMASRGIETLRFGPMKPVGLTDPRTGQSPYAVVQLRQDNALASLYNIVGFQTKMKYGEQIRVFKTIPGLESAEFARLGGMHRNTFINSPKLLDGTLKLKMQPRLRFAGQITGCEGYIESASIGLLAGRFAAAELTGQPIDLPPRSTAIGSLLSHVTGEANPETFQPMNINFGLFPPLSKDEEFKITANGKRKRLKGIEKKQALSARALKDLETWLK